MDEDKKTEPAHQLPSLHGRSDTTSSEKEKKKKTSLACSLPPGRSEPAEKKTSLYESITG